MKITAINFKERKIENCYDYGIIVLHLPDEWLDYSLQEQEKWFDKVKTFITNSQDENALIEIRYSGETNLTDMEQLQIISKIAAATIQEESTNRGYWSIPPYFKDRVFASVDTQKSLGNYKNKFEHLQIDLYENDNLIENLVV